jgi:hypothetical protein
MRANKESIVVDRNDEVTAELLLNAVRRIVFLSVPQKGTYIADWVKSHRYLFKAVISGLDSVLRLTWLFPGLDQLNVRIVQAVGRLLPRSPHILLAAEDSLKEICTNVLPWNRSGLKAAEAREAANDLDLWLNHMIFDFGAIDDLATFGSSETSKHEVDLAILEKYKIKTKTYATRGARPFEFDKDADAEFWRFSLLSPSSFTSWPKPLTAESSSMDLTYLASYRACAGFDKRISQKNVWVRDPGRVLFNSPQRTSTPIETWDNDGIVNTAAMFWPERPTMDEIVIVDNCDHGDILGHFTEKFSAKSDGVDDMGRREYSAYDLLKSGSNNFTEQRFKEVWFDVFKFATNS